MGERPLPSRFGQRSNGRRRLQLAAAGFLVLVLLGPFLQSLSGNSLSGEGNSIRQLGYITVFALAVSALDVWRQPARLLVVPMSLVVVLAWCLLSVTWAIVPGISMRRLFLTTMVIWTIFMTVRHLGYEATLTTLRVALMALLAANFAAVLVAPGVGIHLVDLTGDVGLIGNWRGITVHKNYAGATCAFTIIVFMLDARRLVPATRWFMLMAASAFLWKTSSKTSMGILLVALVCGYLYERYRPQHRMLLAPALTLGLIAAGAVLQGYWDRLEAAFDNPYTLTGRTQIWPIMTEYITDHWLLGSGYGSFWNIGGSSPVFQYASGWVGDLASGHNGYLDILVQTGVPGFMLAVAAALMVPLARVLFVPAHARPRGALIFALLVFCAGHNMTESSLLDRDMPVQVMLMYAIALIGPAVAPTLSRTPMPGEDGRAAA